MHRNHRRKDQQGWSKVRHYHLNHSLKWAKQLSAREARRGNRQCLRKGSYDDLPQKQSLRTKCRNGWHLWGY
jgi:hypothetical protein